MQADRQIDGEIVFPADAAGGVAAQVTVELRDVSAQDQPSALLAHATLFQVPVAPGQRVPFSLRAPPGVAGSALSMRVQVDMRAGNRHAPGDFLSTAAVRVPAGGDVHGLLVPVTRL